MIVIGNSFYKQLLVAFPFRFFLASVSFLLVSLAENGPNPL